MVVVPPAAISDSNADTEPAPGHTKLYYFTLALDSLSPQAVTVYYRTMDGSALSGEDYAGSMGSVRVSIPRFAAN